MEAFRPKENGVGLRDTTANSVDALTREKPADSIAIEIPEISLPKGGGALKGIDEKFGVNPNNGTLSFNVSLPATPGRNGFSPNLSLVYNSGAGNTPFGLGWSLDYPVISRKTDKGLPRYREESDGDIYVFSGAEDLVPLSEQTEGAFTIQSFRPRIEGAFARIEKITHATMGVYWKVSTRENSTTFYGLTADARIADPEDPSRIFTWLPEFSYDSKGNWIWYEYKAEDTSNVPDRGCEKNRRNGLAPFANSYLKRIKYGNRSPYYAEENAAYRPLFPGPDSPYFFELVLDYGEHDSLAPTPEEDRSWPSRADAFSSCRSGFEIRTYRLCRRLLMFHRFEELGATPHLVRSLDMEYEPSSTNGSGLVPEALAEVTYLKSITQSGYIRREDGGYSQKSLPSLEFTYQTPDWNTAVKPVEREDLVNAPAGLSDNYQWVDLYGEGLSGMLTEQGEGWYYKSNLGDAQFTIAREVIARPSVGGLSTGKLSIQDLDADGRKQIVVHSPGLEGFYELSSNRTLKAFQAFEKVANIDLTDARFLDLNGDGRPELVLTEDNVFVWYSADGKKGYRPPESAWKPFDEDQGPAILFSGQDQRIFLADMTGDGLTDIVRIRNGQVCYWANKGYGRFSAKIEMENAPLFDHSDQFHPQYLHLADITGTGATDFIYLGKNKFKAYLNFSGNGWSDAREIEPFFAMHDRGRLSVIDLLGSGTPCIVWSSPLPEHAGSPMQYIDLMDSRMPHLLIHYTNNLGKETSVEYKSSTWYYLEDKSAGRDWITKLPFPVQLVRKVTIEEKITEVCLTNEYRYHHGYYDHPEREFRGFGLVEQIDTEYYADWKINAGGALLESSEALFQNPVLTKTWFHTGAFLEQENILRQFEAEYWFNEMARQGFEVDAEEPVLADALIEGEGWTVEEWKEALRACKGMVLRQEVFALDAPQDDPTEEDLKKQLTPFSVSTKNCMVRLLQARGDNPYAVFLVTEGETLHIQYERRPEDPRIAHSLNIAIDDLGNILEQAQVVYPRRLVDNSLPAEVREAQARTLITLTQNTFTNDVVDPSQYRLRLPAETKTCELTGMPGPQPLFQLDDFKDILLDDHTTEIAYHQSPDGHTPQRRLIAHIQHTYYAGDLRSESPLGALEGTGLPFQTCRLVFTPELLNHIFGDKLPADPQELEDLLGANDNGHEQSPCRFVHRQDANWWIPSGTKQYLDNNETHTDARQRFLTPLSYTDPFGATTRVTYYGDYFLMLNRMEDEIGNVMEIETFNFRTLAPEQIRDINDNRSAVLIDELGLVKAIALMGKGEAGDSLDNLTALTSEPEKADIGLFFNTGDSAELTPIAHRLLKEATVRFVYDFDRYRTSAQTAAEAAADCSRPALKPAVAATISRESHVVPLLPAGSPQREGNEQEALQLRFAYTDGAGNETMIKVQAEPGLARQLTIDADCSATVSEVDTGSGLRWVGNGRTVRNNKGNPVRQYEPYFSTTPFYEASKELTESGVSPVLHYDALGRLTRTDFPDGTFSKVAFTAWQQATYDRNDTVTDSQWYRDRSARMIDAALIAEGKDPALEEAAALKAAAHQGTPAVLHLDTLGRPVCSITHNRRDGTDDYYITRIELDIQGNVRSVTDARGNTTMAYRYDLTGHRVYQNSMDAGERWTLHNVSGNPVRFWDGREHLRIFTYDALQRPLEQRVSSGDGNTPMDHLYQKTVYGEGRPNDKQNNLRGQPHLLYDTAGQITYEAYDFKGNLLRNRRRFAVDYKNIPDWEVADPEALLETESFATTRQYDALNRVTRSEAPDGSITHFSYNAAGLLKSVEVTQNAATRPLVSHIGYNEKGQRTRISYGNGVKTTYEYDSKTFRLLHLLTSPSSGGTEGVLQDLRYTYDPEGNITHLKDEAIPTVFFDNFKIEPAAEYTYDALYRLVEASGREHAAQAAFGPADNWDDLPFLVSHQPGDAMAMRNYIQAYQYDAVGNILQIRHAANAGSWTRDYSYESGHNRLQQTSVGSQTYTYAHHPQHGFLTSMPHLSLMQWNFKDELQASSKQVVHEGTPETTYYVYNAEGRRLRKVTENQAPAGGAPTRKEERFYLGSFEIYRRYEAGGRLDIERHTLHISDNTRRIAMIDTRTRGTDDFEPLLLRYQLDNHLGSAVLELDETAQVIFYEEYHPYGSTAYQARNASVLAAGKRYRYAGKERDEETGLIYYGVRYYPPWLARWIKPDPGGLVDGVNAYNFLKNNPNLHTDRRGYQSEEFNAGNLLDYVEIDGQLYAQYRAKENTWVSASYLEQGWGQVYGSEEAFGAYVEKTLLHEGVELGYPDFIEVGEEYFVPVPFQESPDFYEPPFSPDEPLPAPPTQGPHPLKKGLKFLIDTAFIDKFTVEVHGGGGYSTTAAVGVFGQLEGGLAGTLITNPVSPDFGMAAVNPTITGTFGGKAGEKVDAGFFLTGGVTGTFGEFFGSSDKATTESLSGVSVGGAGGLEGQLGVGGEVSAVGSIAPIDPASGSLLPAWGDAGLDLSFEAGAGAGGALEGSVNVKYTVPIESGNEKDMLHPVARSIHTKFINWLNR